MTNPVSNPGKRSLLAFYLLVAVVVASRLTFPRWLTYDVLSILSWDVFGYYLYLPATFIHHDLGISDFSWVQQILDTYHPTNGFYQAYMGPAGHYVMKYPMGLAILYAPFFLIGHLFAGMMGFQADGFSLPYQISVAMGCLLITIAGIWFLRKILLTCFSEGVTALTMVLVVLGTNYFELTAYDGALVHNALFTIYTLIIWFTIRWHETPTWRTSLLLGLLIGLAVIIRPTEIICVLIPLLWGVWDKKSMQKKWERVTGHGSRVTGIILAIFLVGSLQLIYWKVYAGTWLYYSYEPNEKLQWIAPWLWQVLFSFKKGWLVYTPMMVFSLIGFYRLGNRYRQIFYALFLFTVANILIVASWPTWWYGGSFGQRAMMQSYAVLAFPLAALVQWLLARNIWIKVPLLLVMFLFILLNLFQTWQYMNFLIHPSLMTSGYYWRMFGKTKTDNVAKGFLEGYKEAGWEAMGPEEEYNRKVLFQSGFEPDEPWISGIREDSIVRSGSYSCRLDPNEVFFTVLDRKIGETTATPGSWVRVTFWLYSPYLYKYNSGNFVITMNHQDSNYKYRFLKFEEEGWIPLKWNKLVYTYQIPSIEDPNDRLQIYLWRESHSNLYVDDITVELFEPKDEE
ncbi:MAG: glycosyltransferase family 39 protein [Bacteroidales bacterium]|nr:glycosyltransferase family 39 protein [Bacteroidales bacterium]